MVAFQKNAKLEFLKRVSASFILLVFFWTSVMPAGLSYGQSMQLPQPGVMVRPTAGFNPVMIKGVNLNPDSPLQFNFIIDQGDTVLDHEAFREESTRLVKYFLAALTIPEEEMWVNLSPYESDRIIPGEFGKTEMGRDLLAQDYMLKQLSASLLYPEYEVGKAFWERVHARVGAYGNTPSQNDNIPMNIMNKIWIVPQTAEVYEHERGAFVVESYLKVMLEEEYDQEVRGQKSEVSPSEGKGIMDQPTSYPLPLTSDILRDTILPAIEHEVNHGATFANLRQIYHSVILASWYKQALKESILGQHYVNQHKTEGVDVGAQHAVPGQENDSSMPGTNAPHIQKIYDQYLAAFKQGVYEVIKEEYDPAAQEVISKQYFSGGANLRSTPDLTQVNEGPSAAAMISAAKTKRPMNVAFAMRRDEGGARASAAMVGRHVFRPRESDGPLSLEVMPNTQRRLRLSSNYSSLELVAIGTPAGIEMRAKVEGEWQELDDSQSFFGGTLTFNRDPSNTYAGTLAFEGITTVTVQYEAPYQDDLFDEAFEQLPSSAAMTGQDKRRVVYGITSDLLRKLKNPRSLGEFKGSIRVRDIESLRQEVEAINQSEDGIKLGFKEDRMTGEITIREILTIRTMEDMNVPGVFWNNIGWIEMERRFEEKEFTIFSIQSKPLAGPILGQIKSLINNASISRELEKWTFRGKQIFAAVQRQVRGFEESDFISKVSFYSEDGATEVTFGLRQAAEGDGQLFTIFVQVPARGVSKRRAVQAFVKSLESIIHREFPQLINSPLPSPEPSAAMIMVLTREAFENAFEAAYTRIGVEGNVFLFVESDFDEKNHGAISELVTVAGDKVSDQDGEFSDAVGFLKDNDELSKEKVAQAEFILVIGKWGYIIKVADAIGSMDKEVLGINTDGEAFKEIFNRLSEESLWEEAHKKASGDAAMTAGTAFLASRATTKQEKMRIVKPTNVRWQDLDIIRQAVKKDSDGDEVKAAFFRLVDQVKKTRNEGKMKGFRQRLENGEKIVIRVPVRLFDGPLSSFDLWEMFEGYSNLHQDFDRFELMAALFATISDMEGDDGLYAELIIEKGEKGKVGYQSPNYTDDKENPQGKLIHFEKDKWELNEKGQVDEGPLGLPMYLAKLFDVDGINFHFRLSDEEKMKAGGMETSNAFLQTLLFGLTALTGSTLDAGDLYGIGIATAIGPMADITGLQGFIAGLFGNGVMYPLGGFRAPDNSPKFPYGLGWTPSWVNNDQVRQTIENHVMIARFKSSDVPDYIAQEIKRTATLINALWTILVMLGDEQALEWLEKERTAGEKWKVAMEQGDIPAAQEAMEEYVRLRNLMGGRGINLVLDAQKEFEEGKEISNPIGAHLREIVMEQSLDKSNKFARQFLMLRRLYKKSKDYTRIAKQHPIRETANKIVNILYAAVGSSRRLPVLEHQGNEIMNLLRNRVLYSWDLDKDTQDILAKFNAQAFATGAGGPGGSYIVLIKNPDDYEDLIKALGDRLPTKMRPRIGTKTMDAYWRDNEGNRKETLKFNLGELKSTRIGDIGGQGFASPNIINDQEAHLIGVEIKPGQVDSFKQEFFNSTKAKEIFATFGDLEGGAHYDAQNGELLFTIQHDPTGGQVDQQMFIVSVRVTDTDGKNYLKVDVNRGDSVGGLTVEEFANSQSFGKLLDIISAEANDALASAAMTQEDIDKVRQALFKTPSDARKRVFDYLRDMEYNPESMRISAREENDEITVTVSLGGEDMTILSDVNAFIEQLEDKFKGYQVKVTPVSGDFSPNAIQFHFKRTPRIANVESMISVLERRNFELPSSAIKQRKNDSPTAAMTHSMPTVNEHDVGGIDMNPAMINMNVDGEGVVMPVTPQDLRNFTIEGGLFPVFIHAEPIVNLPLLLGLAGTPVDEEPVDFGRERDPADKRQVLEQVAL